jgi:hypothetical protein
VGAAAAGVAAAQLRDQLQTSPQFQGDAAKVDRLADAPKPSEIADRLEQIAEQARAVARQLDAADKARQVDSLVNDLAERAEGLDMLGQQRPFDAVPFFWSQHYDVTIGYVGHAEKWDALEVEGSPEKLDCVVRYRLGGKLLAVATIGRDRASLEAHAVFENLR